MYAHIISSNIILAVTGDDKCRFFFVCFFKWSPFDCPWGLIVLVKSVSISSYKLFVCLSQLVAAAKSKTEQIRPVAIPYASLKKEEEERKFHFTRQYNPAALRARNFEVTRPTARERSSPSCAWRGGAAASAGLQSVPSLRGGGCIHPAAPLRHKPTEPALWMFPPRVAGSFHLLRRLLKTFFPCTNRPRGGVFSSFTEVDCTPRGASEMFLISASLLLCARCACFPPVATRRGQTGRWLKMFRAR